MTALSLSFVASNPESAIAGANSVATAYAEIRREEASASFEAAIAQLDQSIELVTQDLDRTSAEIGGLLLADPSRSALNRQYSDALGRLVELQGELANGTGTDDTRVALDDIAQQLQTLSLITGLERQDPELDALLEQQRLGINRQSNLVERRDELTVGAELESTGIVLFAPTQEAAESGTRFGRIIAVGLILGVLVGAGLAYLLALRRRAFTDRFEPEAIIGAPLLGEIPDFSDEGITSELPVQGDPLSAAAESFRFVAAALDVQLVPRQTTTGPADQTTPVIDRRPVRSLVLVSARLGEGKSVVAANIALASARQGNRVLVVDADFGYQRLTELLTGKPNSQAGLTEFVEQGWEYRRAVQILEVAGGVRLHLLSRGQEPVTAPDFFRSAAARSFFESARDEYDLILIDSPPLLQVAYASTVVRYADRAIVVVPHRGDAGVLGEVADRLELLGTEPAGYVYNRAPLRDDMTRSEGSMSDVQGRGSVQK